MSRTEYVYTNPTFATASNKGISESFANVEVVAANETSDAPNAVRIVRRGFGKRVLFHAEPINQPEGAVGPMAGGAAISVGSMTAALYPEYPELAEFYGLINLHDRFETAEEYALFSN